MSKIAININAIIKEKCLKQSAIAVKAGYDVKIFNNMLRGRKIITANDIPIIANALEVDANVLLYGKENTAAEHEQRHRDRREHERRNA